MEVVKGFSKFTKEERIIWLSRILGRDVPSLFPLLSSFWHKDQDQQRALEELSENTISNFALPFGVAPNFFINGVSYTVPMVIEESSVVAAAAKAAKFWLVRGGFKAKVLKTTKVGQVHFFWPGPVEVLQILFDKWKPLLLEEVKPLLTNMERRGGGLKDLKLLDKTHLLPRYYQLFGEFDTCDAMGANFINSILEALAKKWADQVRNHLDLPVEHREIEIIMSILSNYTPDCLVHVQVNCPFSELYQREKNMSGEKFARRFKDAVDIARVDPHRATTHNKGIFNGVDAVVMATGNDFRAVEACGHVYAALKGDRPYEGLTQCSLENDHFVFSINLPLSLGTVGGLTSLHPLAKLSLEILGNPSAQELMMIATSVGLAQNFAALRSLVTTGIQQGHMKMHLLNIFNRLNVNDSEREQIKAYFKDRVVSFSEVRNCLESLRKQQ